LEIIIGVKKLKKKKYLDIIERIKNQLIILNDKKVKMKAQQEVPLNDLIFIYETIFQYDNTNENDIVDYLLLFLKKLNKGEIEEKFMSLKLDAYSIFIFDDNYNKYFHKYERINSIAKINNLIDLLKSDLTGDDDYNKRKQFVNNFYALKKKYNSFIVNFKFKQQILGIIKNSIYLIFLLVF